MPKTIRYYFYAAAATTAIAGIVHLILAYKGLSHFGISNFSIFFLVAGIAQLCWTIPLIKDGEEPGIMLELEAQQC